MYVRNEQGSRRSVLKIKVNEGASKVNNLLRIMSILLVWLPWSSFAGDRLLATGGVVQVEGAAGAGLNPWALISGYGTREQIGGAAYATKVRTRGGFELETAGVNLGFYNRFEVSLSQQRFGLSDTVPGETIRMNTLGVKLKLVGDAVYDQDTWVPQVAVGALIKHNEDFDFVPQLLGAEHATGVDYYLSATKVYLAGLAGRNVILNASLHATKANQFGLLGFGGDSADHYKLMPAVSAAVMLSDNLLVGAEYRKKPDNLSAFEEESASDVFVAWFPFKNLSITAAWVDLGRIADKSDQQGWYLSGHVSY